MRKSILVLSALLTLVVSGFCLQSCSSEYDEYTTEDYGSYTEVEVREMKAIAMQYGMSIEFEEDYYGKKSSLQEFERNLISIINLPGDYELVEDGYNNYSLSKKANDISRSKARSEAELPRSGQITISQMHTPCTLYLSWRMPTKNSPGSVNLSALAPFYIIGGDMINGEYTLSSWYIAVNHNFTIHGYGVSYGRFNLSGVYYAEGRQDFRIISVPENIQGVNNTQQ